MSKRIDGQARSKYTLEYKLEAVRLVKDGQAASVTAKVLGISDQYFGLERSRRGGLCRRTRAWFCRGSH
jgi:transposase-like protein